MAKETSSLLGDLSDALSNVVEKAGQSVVRVDDGTRLTATGVVWSSNGVILATSHGVEKDEDLSIETADGKSYPTNVIGRDPDTDLVLLQAKVKGLPAIERAREDTVKVGHLALALGRPGNSGLQATIGIIGSRIESQSGGQTGYILHTDVVLYPGFSGGPLVDIEGRIVGLNNLMYGRGKGVAVGTPILTHIAGALLSHGRVQRGYLGVRTQNADLPKSLGLEQSGGALIVQVESVSPAERAGLLLGDVILAADGQTVNDVDDLRTILRARQAGQDVSLKILRAGAVKEVTASLTSAE